MSNIQVPSGVKSATIEAVVIRADGSREDLGVVAYYHRNPLRRLAWKIGRAIH
jgi:hypothetical protein